MDWVESEAFRLGCPDFADVLVGRKALEGLEPLGKVVGHDEVAQMGTHPFMVVVVVAFDGGVLDGAVHPLDLAIGSRMVWLGQAMLDAAADQAAVQRRARQMRDRRLQGIETVIEGKQRMPAVGDDDGLVLDR